jgi:hypothetical protein
MRTAIGFIVGTPLQAVSRHQTRMYVMTVTQRLVVVLKGNKKVVETEVDFRVTLPGMTQKVRSTDDFAKVADCFVDGILNQVFCEVRTDKVYYELWRLTENGKTWRFE